MPEGNRAVIKRGNIEDEQTGEAYQVFEFKTVSGKNRQVRIPRANSRNACHIYRELLRHNADLPQFQAQGLNEVQWAIDTKVAAQLVYARTLGWRQHFKGFTLASGFIGKPGGNRGVLPPLWASDQELPGLQCKGTLAKWSKAVAEPAMASDSLVLVLAACFAAPLLHVVKRGNFGLNLFGLTPEDRGVVVSVGASVLGLGGDWWFRNAANHYIAPSLEDARAFNDLVLIGGGGEDYGSTTAYRRWRQDIMALSVGRTKPKPRSPALAWRGIFLTTSRNSNEQLAASAYEVRTTAERAAGIDVPAGSRGIFAKPASDLPPSRSQCWGRAKHGRLLAACADQQGTPIRAYITFLIAHRATLKRAIQKHSDAFVALVADRDVPNRHRAITDNVALLYAAGCLAIKAGILPWTRQHLRSGTATPAYRRRRSPASATISHDEMIRRILRRRLHSSAVIPVSRGLRFGPATQSGFWRQREGEVVFTIHAKAFRRWFEDAAQCRAALRWLHRSGLLLLRNRHAIPSPKSTEWAERTPRWPDGTVQRSFVFKALESRRGEERPQLHSLFPDLPPPKWSELRKRPKPRRRSAASKASDEDELDEVPSGQYVRLTRGPGYPPPWRDD